MAASPQFVATPNTQAVKFTDATGTTETSLWSSAAAAGGLVRGITCVLQAAADANARVYLRRGGVSYVLFDVAIPARTVAGDFYPSVPALNLLDPTYLPHVDPEPSRALVMQEGDELTMKLQDALAVGESLDVVTWGGDY